MLILTKAQLRTFINESVKLIYEREYSESHHGPFVNMLVNSQFRHRSDLEKTTITYAIKDYLRSRIVSQTLPRGVDFKDIVNAVEKSTQLKDLQTAGASLRSQLKPRWL